MICSSSCCRRVRCIVRYCCCTTFLILFLGTASLVTYLAGFTMADEDNGWTPLKYYDMIWVGKYTTISVYPDKSSAIEMINEYRSKHGVPHLLEDDKLVAKAQRCADLYALRGEIRDNNVSTIANAKRCAPSWETDFMFFGPKGDFAWLIYLRRWYREQYSPIAIDENRNSVRKEKYNYDSPSLDMLPYYKHFTQMVWKSSRRIGCARSKEPVGNRWTSKDYISMCFFVPKGNLVVDGSVREYVDNVLPPLDSDD